MAYGKPVPASEGAYFICTKCGKQVRASHYSSGGGMHTPVIPSPKDGGACPESASGNHVCQQC